MPWVQLASPPTVSCAEVPVPKLPHACRCRAREHQVGHAMPCHALGTPPPPARPACTPPAAQGSLKHDTWFTKRAKHAPPLTWHYPEVCIHVFINLRRDYLQQQKGGW